MPAGPLMVAWNAAESMANVPTPERVADSESVAADVVSDVESAAPSGAPLRRQVAYEGALPQ